MFRAHETAHLAFPAIVLGRSGFLGGNVGASRESVLGSSSRRRVVAGIGGRLVAGLITSGLAAALGGFEMSSVVLDTLILGLPFDCIVVAARFGMSLVVLGTFVSAAGFAVASNRCVGVA